MNIIASYQHHPLSPLQIIVCIKKLMSLSNKTLEEVALLLDKDVNKCKYMIQIETEYAERIKKFIELNDLTHPAAADALHMTLDTLNDYLSLLS